MEVILTKSVKKLGKVGDTVKVKSGYGRNYLLPNELAIRATKSNIALFEEQKKVLAANNEEAKSKASVASKKMENKNIIFILQAAADGRLFGSVSTKLIAHKLSGESGFSLNYSNIILDHPIKFTGVYPVEIAYHAEVHGTINVVAARSESEAQELIVEALEEKKSNAKKDSEVKAVPASVSESDAASAE